MRILHAVYYLFSIEKWESCACPSLTFQALQSTLIDFALPIVRWKQNNPSQPRQTSFLVRILPLFRRKPAERWRRSFLPPSVHPFIHPLREFEFPKAQKGRRCGENCGT